MRRFILAALFALGAPLHAQAQCHGDDLRTTLTPDHDTAIETGLADMPYPVGNHWMAEKDGEIIHLIGTVHLDDPRLDGPYTRLRPVIQNAGLLMLEMTAHEEATLMDALKTRADLLILTQGSVPQYMSDENWTMLSAALQDRGLPAMLAAKMQPWYLSMLLAIPTCLKEALNDRQGLDTRLESLAKTNGIATRSLEPYDTVFKAFGDIPVEVQIDMVLSALVDEATGDDLFETVLAGYFDEAHGEMQLVMEVLTPQLSPLTEAENQVVFDTMTQKLITARNQAWIPEILQATTETDKPVVAAFGAAHLPGPDGVLKLLEDQGFTLTRQQF